jgi:hypothetical protein
MALFMLGFISCYAFLASIYIMMISNRNNQSNNLPSRWRE